jgi:hypothetical protein
MSKSVDSGQKWAAPPSKPPRFGWPMRLFLSFLIFDMVFHSLAALTDYRDWMENGGDYDKKEWTMERFPERLPTIQEIADIGQAADPDVPSPVADRFFRSLDSVWDYFKPWPSKESRRHLDSSEDIGWYALSWLTSRLDFFESLVNIPQRWTMFSPSASKEATVARSRLVFRDGSQEIVRLKADPEDLTSYSHWFQEKVLDYELKVAGRDWDSRFGYCNYLSHRHKTNGKGSPLAKIYIYEIKYKYPDPGEDAHAVLAAQNGPPAWDRDGPKHEYDVASREMRRLKDDEQRKALQKRLDSGVP